MEGSTCKAALQQKLFDINCFLALFAPGLLHLGSFPVTLDSNKDIWMYKRDTDKDSYWTIVRRKREGRMI